MNPAELAQGIEILAAIAQILDRLGIGGFIMLFLSGPIIALVVNLVIDYHRGRKNAELFENSRKENRDLLETYRADMQKILRELGSNQTRTDGYYRDNVALVHQYERISKNLQDVVVSNTQAVTRLVTMLEERRKHQ